MTKLDDTEKAAPIVLVDDTDDDTFFTERLLREVDESVPIIKFASPLEAVAALEAHEFGTVQPLIWLVDVRMPNLSGFDVVKQIRAHREMDLVPVVMLSGSDEARDLAMARQVGADCYLKKFPSVPEMQAVLECARAFGGHDASRSADFSVPCNMLSTLAV